MYGIYDPNGKLHTPDGCNLTGKAFQNTFNGKSQPQNRSMGWSFTLSEYLKFGHGIASPDRWEFAILNRMAKDSVIGDIFLLRRASVQSYFKEENHEWSVFKLELIEAFPANTTPLWNDKHKKAILPQQLPPVEDNPNVVLEVFYVKANWAWPNGSPSPALAQRECELNEFHIVIG